MLESDEEYCLKCYREFLIYRRQVLPSASFAEYDWIHFPDPIPIDWFAYSQMSSEYAREISNSINQLNHLIRSTEAWNGVIEPLPADRKQLITRELIDPIATVAVNLPSVIRSRFIFASVHLCHQANKAIGTDGIWNDDLEVDTEIDYNSLNKRFKDWRSLKSLNNKLQGLGSNSSYEKLRDFRNAYNHRFSPRFVVGITQSVKRTVNESGKPIYEFGGADPLDLSTVANELKDQLKLCLEAFVAFKKLVEEHIRKIIQYESRG